MTCAVVEERPSPSSNDQSLFVEPTEMVVKRGREEGQWEGSVWTEAQKQWCIVDAPLITHLFIGHTAITLNNQIKVTVKLD